MAHECTSVSRIRHVESGSVCIPVNSCFQGFPTTPFKIGYMLHLLSKTLPMIGNNHKERVLPQAKRLESSNQVVSHCIRISYALQEPLLRRSLSFP